jgi:hypothetical protein
MHKDIVPNGTAFANNLTGVVNDKHEFLPLGEKGESAIVGRKSQIVIGAILHQRKNLLC